MYESITSYLGKLKPAEIVPPKKTGENSFIMGYPRYDEVVSELMHKMYDVVPNGGQNYDKVVYKNTGVDCHEDLSKIDISNLDGETILFIIFSVIRDERFCDGLVSSYIQNGAMDKWLSRLKEIDEQNK